MSTAIIERPAETHSVIEDVIIKGDLGKLSAEDRATYYMQVCQSLGLNPHTQPFSYIILNGKLTLYVNKIATDQLRGIHRVSTEIVSREYGDAAIVTARARTPDGRSDESIGAVWIKGLAGDAYVNAIMKAETKSKRRATLALLGLGMLDESELETIPNARRPHVDDEGEGDAEPMRAAVTPIREEPPADEWQDAEPPPARYTRSAPPQRARSATGMGAGFRTPQLIERMNADYGYTIAEGTPLWQVIATVEERYGEEVPSEGVDDAGKPKRYPATIWNHVKAQEAGMAAE